jgi:predicted nucleotidyltransferase
MDGSTAEGKDRRYSDYDIAVVKKKPLRVKGEVGDLTGMFNGRVVSGWILDDVSFRRRYIGTDDKEFVWRRRRLQKVKLLYGDAKEFDKIIGAALSRRWNRRRQLAVIRDSYGTMVEYLGKMLNKVEAGEAGTYEFYQDGYVVASLAAIVVAALNRIDLDSDKTMFRDVISQARVMPSNFERDFATASGFTGERRNREEVVLASKRLVKWAREQIIRSFGPPRRGEEGFWQIVKEVRY